MTDPLVSVVMLSFNRKDDVAEGIGKLKAQNYQEIEIIVVDNGSSDQTAEMVRETFSDVRLIALKDNIGVAAYNTGFDQAKGKYIVILDDDSFPEQNAIPRMVEEFESNDKLGIIAFDVRNYYEYDKSNTRSPDLKNHPSVQKSNEKEKTTPDSRYQMAFNGAGVGIRRNCIMEVGGYPEEFFLYWNEQDLSIRVLDAGYQLQWFTDIISFHKYSPANRESWRAPFYYTRNLYWLIWKYFPLKKVLKDSVRLFFYSIYYTFDQKTMIYLKATFSALLNSRRLRRRPAKKEIIQNLRLTYRLPFVYYK